MKFIDKNNLRQTYSNFISKKINSKKTLILHGDSAEPFRLSKISNKNIINFGISEQNMVTAAAGLSSLGFNVWVNSFCQFLSTRALEQIRNGILYPDYPVKLVGCHYGLDVAEDGATHQCIEDIGIFNSTPNITILSPSDIYECKEILKFAHAYKKPCYIRLPKSNMINLNSSKYKFRLGILNKISSNKFSKYAIIGSGSLFDEIIKTIGNFKKKGLLFDLYSAPTIKPLNSKFLISTLSKYKKIFVIEDHNITSGLGSIISNILINKKINIYIKGVNDTYAESGDKEDILNKYNLNSKGLINFIEKNIKN